jgi:deoxyribonuclease V
LDDVETPGLGAHLYNRLDNRIPVIGVAKNRYKTSDSAIEILRGKSKKPLYITAVGVDLISASKYIQCMHGDNRIPTLLKKVDQISRNAE